MSNNSSRIKNKWIVVSAVVALMIISSCFAGAGILIGMRYASNPEVQFPPMVLNADSAARGKQISLASGQVDDNVEGLFILDHLTGDIQCWLLNARTGGVAAIFKSNAAIELGNEKTADADYVMTTGRFFFDGGNTGNMRPGRCICYVADGNSGKVIGFGMTYNQQAIIRGGAQAGKLAVVCRGVIRGAVERDQ